MKCICCSSKKNIFFKDKKLLIYECSKCKTISVIHLKINKTLLKKDYYENEFYLQKYLSLSLENTRKRQALKLLKFLRTKVKKDQLIIDYGCGKGVFLKKAKELGYKNLLGVESSGISIEILKKHFNIIKVKFNNSSLSFYKQHLLELKNLKLSTLLFLDVIEHFPNKYFHKWFKKILIKFQNPKLLIIKVPLRVGILFNFSLFLAKKKISIKPLYQLLQVDTHPPHYSYFSEKGLVNLMKNYDYELIKKMKDLDYELISFADRLSIKGIKKFLINFLISPIIFLYSNLTGQKESIILIFKFSKQKL